LEKAAQALPPSADVLVHAAAVVLALNDAPKAKMYLDAAIKADPKVAERPDVKALREKIAK
jgi:hypothetical protein